MPPQTPSDQGHPRQARWNETRTDEALPLTQPVGEQRPAAAAPLPPAPAATSRRSILRGVAAVGVVGAAGAAGFGAATAATRNSAPPTLMPAAKPVAMAPMAPEAMAGPLVVYIADTTTGLLDVFGGTGQTRVRNPALVKQLLANLKLA